MVFLLCVLLVASLWAWSLGAPLSPWSGVRLLLFLPFLLLPAFSCARVLWPFRLLARRLFLRLPWWWSPCPGSLSPPSLRARLHLALRRFAWPS